jgi:fatty acid desaturase
LAAKGSFAKVRGLPPQKQILVIYHPLPHMRPAENSGLFRYSRYDAIPVLSAIAQFTFLCFLFLAFPRLSWWVLIPLGFVWSISISWNINGISHNFLHNPYFRSKALNRAFSVLESVTVGFSQIFYEQVHKDHHKGNADLPDENGQTRDPLSIYKYGHDGLPENPWTYVFFSYFRDDAKAIYRSIQRKSRGLAYRGIFEIALFLGLYAAAGIANWRFLCYFLPFYYFGHCLSYLNGYYLHYGGKPDVPLAWGVSSYHKLYNWLWFNNGYHAEHHFRPRVHWTKMKQLHAELRDDMARVGTRVIALPHALGFLCLEGTLS